MSKGDVLANCPRCGKLIALIFPIHDCRPPKPVWKWDTGNRAFYSKIAIADLEVHWHKVGGRGSKGQGASFWTYHVHFDESTAGGHHEHFKTSKEAKAAAEQAVRDHWIRCPDCEGSIADHNSVNRVKGGMIAHSRTGGACWKSLNTEFTRALERARPPKK